MDKSEATAVLDQQLASFVRRSYAELVAIVDAEFVEDAIEVSLHRPYRQNQAIGNLTIGQTGLDQHRNLALSTALSSPDSRNTINIVLAGIPSVAGERSPIMPAFAASMSDVQIVALLNKTQGAERTVG